MNGLASLLRVTYSVVIKSLFFVAAHRIRYTKGSDLSFIKNLFSIKKNRENHDRKIYWDWDQLSLMKESYFVWHEVQIDVDL